MHVDLALWVTYNDTASQSKQIRREVHVVGGGSIAMKLGIQK